MAETTAIAWAHATFNPWIGCTEVSTAANGGGGCDDCYARALDTRHKWGGATHWGAGVPRMRTSEANWRKPLTWQRHADNGLLPDGKTPRNGVRPRVFCASLADIFDNEVPDEWRRDLWDLIELTPGLTWMLLTKRIVNAPRMLRTLDWCAGRPNVWLGATVVNKMEAERDLPKLRNIPARIRFASNEPALGGIDWTNFPWLNWIIVGGGQRYRLRAPEFNIDFARNMIAQARQIGAAPFVKQFGSSPQEIAYPDASEVTPQETQRWQRDGWTQIHVADGSHPTHWRRYYRLKDRAGANPAEWPEHLRVQEFPE